MLLTKRVFPHLLVILAILNSPTFMLGAETQGAESDPGFRDSLIESKLLYRKYSAELKGGRSFRGLPLFVVKVNSAGVGHLQTNIIQANGLPRSEAASTETNIEGLLKHWRERVSFPSESGWKQLSFDDAEALWGSPRKYIVREKEFYTFDAKNESGEEENIYHLDLQFGNNNVIDAYRIRGIGITNPRWVTQKSVNSEITQKSLR